MEPRIQYAQTTDGVSIAFATMGEGEPLVFAAPPPFCHVQLDWEIPVPNIAQPLSRAFRFVWFDWRGTGLSDRDAVDFSMDARLRDIEAVVARNGLETFALCGLGGGALIAVTYAAARPERISRLVLVDGWAKWSELEELPAWQAEKALRGKDWGVYTEAYTHIVWGIDDPEFGRIMGEYLRACVESEAHQAAFAAAEDWDVSALLPRVTAPTLVVQNQNSRFVTAQSGQRLASRIPDANFKLVDDPSWARLPAAIEEFILQGTATAHTASSGAFRTILFTDVEGSTALTQRLGDAKARQLLREHERIVRDALKAHGGSEVKTMGDGFMASFGSATRALECAIAMQRAFAEWNEGSLRSKGPSTGSGRTVGEGSGRTEVIRVRIGLNAGEPIAEDDPDGRADLFGTAVNLAARIAGEAEGGEVLASDVVRQLVAGKRFMFADRGETALRGFEEPVRLYEVRWREKE